MNKENNNYDTDILATLRRRALGYAASEQTTEFDSDGKEVRQRVTTKDVPPDLTAIRMLLELEPAPVPTEEELEAERAKVMAEIREYYRGGSGDI